MHDKLQLTSDEYRQALDAVVAPLEPGYVRCLVDLRCPRNRAWLRGRWPETPISCRHCEAVSLPLAAFDPDPELHAMLRLSDSIVVVAEPSVLRQDELAGRSGPAGRHGRVHGR